MRLVHLTVISVAQGAQALGDLSQLSRRCSGEYPHCAWRRCSEARPPCCPPYPAYPIEC
jgi:hypothetical protein